MQIIAIHQSDGDWRTKASELGVAVSTAYRWVSTGLVVDKRGGKMTAKVMEEHRNHMVNLIEGKCLILLPFFP